MTRKQLLTGSAIYYGGFLLIVLSGASPFGGSAASAVFLFYMITVFPISPAFIGGCLYAIRQREAAEAAHQHELDMQDRLARRIALETNGPAPTPTPTKEPIGFHVPTAKKGSA